MTQRHSKRFPPSAAGRWLACRRSVPFIDSLPPVPRTASRYAAEGTLAHQVAEAVLEGRTPAPVGETKRIDGHLVAMTAEMHQHAETWREIVLKRGPKPQAEHEVDLSAVVGPAAGMFGNLDASQYTANTLSVFDFKYGRGIEVYPDDNPQLLIYALGAYYALDPVDRDRVDTVEMVIVQPRTPNGDPERISAISDLDLLIWADKVLKPAVKSIVEGAEDNSPFVTGDHCRFCPAAAHCPGLKERAHMLATKQFNLNPTEFAGQLSDDEVGQQMLENEIIQLRIDAVAAEGLRRAQAGRKIKFHKLVAKRANREWADPLAAAIWLREHGAETPDWYTRPELKSPAQIEKLIDKRQVPAMNREIVKKESSGTSLVRETDPRPEMVVQKPDEIFSDIPVSPQPAPLDDKAKASLIFP